MRLSINYEWHLLDNSMWHTVCHLLGKTLLVFTLDTSCLFIRCIFLTSAFLRNTNLIVKIVITAYKTLYLPPLTPIKWLYLYWSVHSHSNPKKFLKGSSRKWKFWSELVTEHQLEIPAMGWLQISDFHRTQEIIKHTIWVTNHAFQIELVRETVFLKQELLFGGKDYWLFVCIQAC